MPKPIGLANLGNTCFLNSCLQILFQIPELSRLKHNPNNAVPSACLVDEWHTLVGLLNQSISNSNSTFLSPARFVQAVRGVAAHTGNHQFNGYDQNDASEFLYFLLNGWHEACKRPVRMEISGTGTTEKDKMAIACYQTLKQTYEKEYSEIMQLFFGISANKTAESEYRAELFSMLHVPVAESIPECIRGYLQNTPANCQMTFWDLPKYLFIVIGRFSGDNARPSNGMVFDNARLPSQAVFDKDMRDVQIPMELDMAEFVSSYNPQRYKYKLMGAILHMGSIYGGHYVNVVRSGDEWYSCNDTAVFKEDGFDAKLLHPTMTKGTYVAIYSKV